MGGFGSFREKAPNFASSAGKSSKLWKFSEKKFQALEVFREKVPSFGNSGTKASRDWECCGRKFSLPLSAGRIFMSAANPAAQQPPPLSSELRPPPADLRLLAFGCSSRCSIGVTNARVTRATTPPTPNNQPQTTRQLPFPDHRPPSTDLRL